MTSQDKPVNYRTEPEPSASWGVDATRAFRANLVEQREKRELAGASTDKRKKKAQELGDDAELGHVADGIEVKRL